jgi:hypothetical protein
MFRRLLTFGVLAAALLTPRAASAITVDQIVALAKSGVTDVVILALIDRDRTVFAIAPEQIVSLQRDGISEKVLLAMLRSGRDEGELAARADSASNSAWIAATLTSEPESISVGHGPDRPNTPHIDGFYSGPPAPSFYAAPWTGSSFRGKSSRRSSSASVGVRTPMLCYAQISTQHVANQTPFVTVCPEVMQPGRERR